MRVATASIALRVRVELDGRVGVHNEGDCWRAVVASLTAASALWICTTTAPSRNTGGGSLRAAGCNQDRRSAPEYGGHAGGHARLRRDAVAAFGRGRSARGGHVA